MITIKYFRTSPPPKEISPLKGFSLVSVVTTEWYCGTKGVPRFTQNAPMKAQKVPPKAPTALLKAPTALAKAPNVPSKAPTALPTFLLNNFVWQDKNHKENFAKKNLKKKEIGVTICIRWEIWCLQYAGFSLRPNMNADYYLFLRYHHIPNVIWEWGIVITEYKL